MSQPSIKVGGGEVLASSTPGRADGRYRVYLDISGVAGTGAMDLAVRTLQDIVRPGNLLGVLSTVSLILGTVQHHGADGG